VDNPEQSARPEQLFLPIQLQSAHNKQLIGDSGCALWHPDAYIVLAHWYKAEGALKISTFSRRTSSWNFVNATLTAYPLAGARLPQSADVSGSEFIELTKTLISAPLAPALFSHILRLIRSSHEHPGPAAASSSLVPSETPRS